MRPQMSGRKCVGSLEAHQVHYTLPRSCLLELVVMDITILYSEIIFIFFFRNFERRKNDVVIIIVYGIFYFVEVSSYHNQNVTRYFPF